MTKKDPEEKVTYQEIHDTKMEDLATPKEDLEIPDEVVEQAIEKTQVEEKAEQVPENEEVEEVDIEDMEKRISEKVQKETVEKITKALTGEEAKEEEVSDYKKFANETWKKEGRNPTYEEALEFVSEKAMDRLEEKRLEKEKIEIEKIESQKKSESEREATLNKYIDSELEDLVSSGKLPKIVDKDNPNDQGVLARKAVFQAMLEVNTERTKAGKDLIYSPKIVYYEHYKAPNAQPAGADAPISGGRSGVSSEGDNKVNYNDIHNRSFLDIMLGR